ncbi:MAG: tyrosine-type recombinase/integrase [Candidatus Bathyarchaeia archaeon]
MTLTPACPSCGSDNLYKDGLRYLRDGSSVQRWLCRKCGYRFTDPKHKAKTGWRNLPSGLNPCSSLFYPCQGNNDPDGRVPSALEAVQTLATVEKENEKRAAGATKIDKVDVKGKIIEFLWWTEKQGLAPETIRGYRSCLKALMDRGANLFDPESVKEVLAKEKNWSPNRRRNVINSYTKFLRFLGLSWDKPKCYVPKKLPSFIPMESETDALIAGSNKTLACFLQLLKETAMRAGEAFRLKWTDIDFERRVIVLNEPEKGSNPRVWRISSKLVEMLNSLQRKSEKIFPNKSLASLKNTFLTTRKRLAHKLQNPRLLRIGFHTIRHWKATMEYHKTRDILYVKNLLGHKKIENTEIYINLEKAIFGDTTDQEYHVKVAQKTEEIKALLEVGFEYICEKDGLMFFRKRK